MISKEKGRRAIWLDECKGLGIILVVLGHAIALSIRSYNKYFMFIYNLIYYFHMPFMMFLSGLAYRLFTESKSKKSMIIKKIKRLLVPYIMYAVLIEVIIIGMLKISFFQRLLYSRGYEMESCGNFIFHLIVGDNKYTTHLWYIYALFIFYVFIIVSKDILNYRQHMWMGIILFAVKCIFDTDGLHVINNICTLYSWFSAGVNTDIESNVFTVLKNCVIRHILEIIAIIYFVTDIIFIPTPHNIVLYTIHTMVKFSIIYFFIMALIFECMYIKRNIKWLSYLGEKSFIIYLFHQPFICMGVVTILTGKVPDIIAVGVGVSLSFVCTLTIDRILDMKYMKYIKKIFKG